MFLNDTHPRAAAADGALRSEAGWKVEPAVVKGASAGSGATIPSEVTIGEHAVAGGGGIVTKDVAPDANALAPAACGGGDGGPRRTDPDGSR